jgi:hypothetical protein
VPLDSLAPPAQLAADGFGIVHVAAEGKPGGVAGRIGRPEASSTRTSAPSLRAVSIISTPCARRRLHNRASDDAEHNVKVSRVHFPLHPDTAAEGRALSDLSSFEGFALQEVVRDDGQTCEQLLDEGASSRPNLRRGGLVNAMKEL